MVDARHFEAVMREQIGSLNAGDSAAVATLFAEDGRFVDMGAPLAAHVGRESIRLLVDSFIQAHDLGASLPPPGAPGGQSGPGSCPPASSSGSSICVAM